MAGLRQAHKSNPCVRFALQLRSAWSLNNYSRFFRLLFPSNSDERPPLRCSQVVQWFLGRERKEAAKTYFKVCVSQLAYGCLWFLCSIVGKLGCKYWRHLGVNTKGFKDSLADRLAIHCKVSNLAV